MDFFFFYHLLRIKIKWRLWITLIKETRELKSALPSEAASVKPKSPGVKPTELLRLTFIHSPIHTLKGINKLVGLEELAI